MTLHTYMYVYITPTVLTHVTHKSNHGIYEFIVPFNYSCIYGCELFSH